MGRNFNNKRAVAEPVILEKDNPVNKQRIAAQQYTGPIPTAEEFLKYGQVMPDAPERILRVFEADSEHVRGMQIRALNGEISRDCRGQWMAFVILMGLLLVVTYALYLGNIAFAGIAGLTFIGMAVGGFLKKENKNDKIPSA
jgi:uncharacterized membrane protein